MRILDVNLLLYAIDETSARHQLARPWLEARELLTAVGTAGNLVPDAHLAALSIEHGAEMCSSDADFSRFPGVRWVDPLR